MKWRDSGEMIENEEKPAEEYFDEEQYSPWAERKSIVKHSLLRNPRVLVAAGVVVVVLIIFTAMAVGRKPDVMSTQKAADLEARLAALEDRLDKFAATDETVKRIWDQAKSYESFKERFDRSEASISLRMDHLTMSFEALQKELADLRKTTHSVAAASAQTPPAAVSTQKTQQHQVAAGETFYSISKKYNMEVEELLKLNRLNAKSVLRPGQSLIVNR